MRPGQGRPGRIMKAVPPASGTQTGTVWHGSAEMSRRHSQPANRDDRAARWAANGEQAGGHRLHTRTHRRGLAHASSMDRCTDAQVPCRLRRPAASTENQAQDQQADPGPPANGKACRHGVSANGLTWVALGARFARQGGVCPPPSLHGLHDDDDDDDDDDDVSPSPTHQPTGTTTGRAVCVAP
jgi:hypothetical protein